MHVMCAVCLHDSAERECEQRQEDDEQASTISLSSYKAEGNMDIAHVELSAPQGRRTMMRIWLLLLRRAARLLCVVVSSESSVSHHNQQGCSATQMSNT